MTAGAEFVKGSLLPQKLDSTRWIFWGIMAGYVLIASLYATLTPLWQVPDEPAHFNYIRYLAEQRRFPVLQIGDYPHEYLERIKERRFPADMSIAPLRYEFHQPPLYYMAAAGVYMLIRALPMPAQVYVLRLFSVGLGAVLLFVTYQLILLLFPRRPALALGTMGFMAFLPMHVAMLAGINNDALAELLIGVILWLLARYLISPSSSDGAPARYSLLPLGVALGLGLSTKMTVYYVLPVVIVGIAWGEWNRHPQQVPPLRRIAHSVRALALTLGIGLVLVLPWYIRNVVTYGGIDILGLGRHDAVVAGQLRTGEWIAHVGIGRAITLSLTTTFHSFWGQFGWMGVPLDDRLYALFALITLLLGAGIGLGVYRLFRGELHLTSAQMMVLVLFGLLTFLTAGGYFWYNMQFVQHQGRYLFPALIPLGLLVAVGLRQLISPVGARMAGLLMGIGMFGLGLYGVSRGDMPWLWLAITGSLGAIFAVAGKRFSSPHWSAGLAAVFYMGLAFCDILCLFGFILPALAH